MKKKITPMDNFQKSLVVVNTKDEIIGTARALSAHIKDTVTLHRAFSVFLFDNDNKMLLTKRAPTKLVYPNVWTNACCSHPFISRRSFYDPIGDARNHAIKRLEYELGITEVNPDDLVFVGRMIYKATDKEEWGSFLKTEIKAQEYVQYEEGPIVKDTQFDSKDFVEYEIDYVFFIRMETKIVLRPTEVSAFLYLSEEEFKSFSELKQISPWLKLMKNEATNMFNWEDGINNK